MRPGEAACWVDARVGAVLRAEPLSGGLLNHVFRVFLKSGETVILKHAPPFVAAAPELPLDPARATVEAQALAHVGPPVAPRLLLSEGPILLLEDLGPLPDLASWLQAGGDPGVVARLARWLRALHEGPVPAIDNRAVQQTRLAVQYRQVEGWLQALGAADAAVLGQAAVDLGLRWLEPGPAFVMGDLWPPSVLVRESGAVHVIDWELSTPGWPAQDLGHLVAHLALGALRGQLQDGLPEAFLRAYGPISAQTRAELELHAGAELLARTSGPFALPGIPATTRQRAGAEALRRLRRGAGR